MQIAALSGLNRNTVNHLLTHIKLRIVEMAARESPFRSGAVEVDESYFGARRVRGKRGRAAVVKTPVFGILKRGGRVFLTVVIKCSKNSLMLLIKWQVLENTTI